MARKSSLSMAGLGALAALACAMGPMSGLSGFGGNGGPSKPMPVAKWTPDPERTHKRRRRSKSYRKAKLGLN